MKIIQCDIKAFSLAEIMVVMIITGIIIIAIIEGMILVRKYITGLENRMNDGNEKLENMDLVSRLIRASDTTIQDIYEFIFYDGEQVNGKVDLEDSSLLLRSGEKEFLINDVESFSKIPDSVAIVVKNDDDRSYKWRFALKKDPIQELENIWTAAEDEIDKIERR